MHVPKFWGKLDLKWMTNKYLKFIPKLSLKLKWKTGTVFCAPGEIDRSNKSPELMDG